MFCSKNFGYKKIGKKLDRYNIKETFVCLFLRCFVLKGQNLERFTTSPAGSDSGPSRAQARASFPVYPSEIFALKLFPISYT